MILDEICEHKRTEVDAAKSKRSRKTIETEAADAPAPRDFRAALRKDGISLIAEIKRASPTKGVFMDGVNIVDLASLYERAGARALSILTDQKYFRGTLDDLVMVRKNVDIPCLRKEFIIDDYQIFESRAAGADAILLIVRILSDEQIKDYSQIARGLGMAVLVETHDALEVERALNCGAAIIGINNRDLSTFNVDINTTLELKKKVPGGKVLVSESGINSREQVQLLEGGGVDAILVGESLVTSKNIAGKIRELLGKDEG